MWIGEGLQGERGIGVAGLVAWWMGLGKGGRGGGFEGAVLVCDGARRGGDEQCLFETVARKEAFVWRCAVGMGDVGICRVV